MDELPIQKIISGGQTGVDRAALDAAIFHEIPHGGWCPKGRLAEDGRIPDVYLLRENDSPKYAKRTERNVVDSDGTLILYSGTLSGGTKLTRSLARRHNRPCLCVDLDLAGDAEPDLEADEVRKWIAKKNIAVLNVAGPRASTNQEIGAQAESFLLRILENR